jgi:predicted MFS family arabinose efflux permease
MVAAGIMIFALIAMLRTRGGKVNPLAGFRSPETDHIPVAVLTAIFAAVLLRVIGEGVVRTFLNIYLDDGLQMTVVNIGLLLGVGQLLAVPAAMAFPLFTLRWGPIGIYLACTLGMAVSFIPMALIPHWAIAGFSYMTVMALVSLARPAIVAVQLGAVRPSWHTVMTGTTSTAVGLGWALASLTGGFLVTSFGYPSLFIASAVMTGGGALVFWLYFRVHSTSAK